jgi:hypothetical protein
MSDRDSRFRAPAHGSERSLELWLEREPHTLGAASDRGMRVFLATRIVAIAAQEFRRSRNPLYAWIAYSSARTELLDGVAAVAVERSLWVEGPPTRRGARAPGAAASLPCRLAAELGVARHALPVGQGWPLA